jgi:hypothetical protein
MREFETKDSGERAQFESGMQRDTEAGKPRFDLMIPLDVPYEEQMITRLAALFGRGAVKYESRNWEQANSEEEMARMKSSGFRHFMQWMAGETDEDHAAAVMFNIIAHETTAYKVAAARRGLEAAPTPDGSDCEPVVDPVICIWSTPYVECPVLPLEGCDTSKHRSVWG